MIKIKKGCVLYLVTSTAKGTERERDDTGLDRRNMGLSVLSCSDFLLSFMSHLNGQQFLYSPAILFAFLQRSEHNRVSGRH